MPSLKNLLAGAAAMATFASAETIKITATSDNTFDPETVQAAEGDIIEFHFQPKNHSVVAGAYNNPCSPLQLGTGFFSGFVTSDDGEADQVFQVEVNSTEPIAFYSSVGEQCPGGMVGMINPNDEKTLAEYKDAASKLASSVSPGHDSYGGDFVDSGDASSGNDDGSDGDNNDGSSNNSKDGKDGNDGDGDSAAGALKVSATGLFAAVGVAVFLA